MSGKFKAEIKVVFLDNFKRISTIMEALSEGLPHLEFIVHFSKFTEDEKQKIKMGFENSMIEIYSFDEFLVSQKYIHEKNTFRF